MNLDDFIITCFCWIDDLLPSITQGQRLRQRGPMPQLADSEVLTVEVVGSYLGLNQDSGLFASFQAHYAHFFPRVSQVHRSTFVRQAANLWAVKERLWMTLRDSLIQHDEWVGIIDSMPLPVCRFARAPWCVRFRGLASYGKDHTDRQTFYGFRLHLRLG
jgi:hypothetical protein